MKTRTAILFSIACAIPLLDAKPSRTQVCIPGDGCINESGRPEISMSIYHLYLKNRSRHPISACVEYYANYNRATIDGGGANLGNGCWNVAPGKQVFAIDDASGRYASFSADAVDAIGLSWEHNQNTSAAKGQQFALVSHLNIRQIDAKTSWIH